ncbi:MAG TPA: DNA circularization N-terminal domain-containing protein [Candidatus Solibacter sp.]
MAGTIRDIKIPWRNELLPASFRGAMFHVETGSKESGRHVVVHEFPKREFPYSEDMGKRTEEFSVRGYIVTFPTDTEIPLYSKDYRVARDLLIEALERPGPAPLQLPTMHPFLVMCPQYRWSEEERAGGFCIFDMLFVEYGLAPSTVPESTRDNLQDASNALRERVLTVMSGLEQATAAAAAAAPKPPLGPAVPPSRRIAHVQR